MKKKNIFRTIIVFAAAALFLTSSLCVAVEVDKINELLKDFPSVMAENRADSTVITGWVRDESERSALDKILEKYPDLLDLTTPDVAGGNRMVEVDVIIVVVSETISNSRGFNFLKLVNMQYDFFAASHQDAGYGYLAPGVVGDLYDVSQWGNMFQASMDYDVNIANADHQQVKVIARPHLTTLNGEKAEFLAGGEIVFKVQGIESGDIKPYPFGIQLNVIPTILKTTDDSNDSQVMLDVEASRLSVLGLQLTSGESGSSEDINFDKTMIKSKNIVRMNETLCISGLYQREYRSRNTGVPFLSKIPILNMLFSEKTEVDDVLSTMIFITPREPAIINKELLDATENFIQRRSRYIEAKEKGGEAIKEFKKDYPDWYKPQPNGYASHFFLVNNSNIYRTLRGEDLRMENLRRDLMQVESAAEAAKKRRSDGLPFLN